METHNGTYITLYSTHIQCKDQIIKQNMQVSWCQCTGIRLQLVYYSWLNQLYNRISTEDVDFRSYKGKEIWPKFIMFCTKIKLAIGKWDLVWKRNHSILPHQPGTHVYSLCSLNLNAQLVTTIMPKSTVWTQNL